MNVQLNHYLLLPNTLDVQAFFFDKQRVLKVMSYNQGCGCYSHDSRRTNPVIDHFLIIYHHSLTESLKIDNFSSIKLSLLYQNVVFSLQVRKTSLDLTDEFLK